MARAPLALAPAILLLALAGCGSSGGSGSESTSSSSAAPPSGPGGATIQAKMANFAFAPKVIHAKAGQSIHWINDDSAPHNVTETSGPKFTASPTFGRGGSFTLRLTQPGTYQYFCTVHPFMKATIVVSQ